MGLAPIVRKNCSCCKKLRDSSYYKNNDEICVPCCIFCNGKGVCQILGEELVELFYNYKKFFVRKSDIDNKRSKIVMLPDGTTFDLTQMYVDTTDKHGNKLERPCFRGSNSDYEIWGQLPVVGVIRAEGLEDAEKYLDGPVCPTCHGSNVEYLCNHWVCHDCQWKTATLEYKPEPPKDINPNENIGCDIGDDD